MRKKSSFLPASKPRNKIVRALVERFRIGAGRHTPARDKRSQNIDSTDLAQRVREVGEW